MKKSYLLLCISIQILFLGCAESAKTKNSSSNMGGATPSPRLRVLQADSQEERDALNEPFQGVTKDGKFNNRKKP